MENFTDDTDKRKRSSNWDSSEISLLRQLVQDNMSTLQTDQFCDQQQKELYLERHCCPDQFARLTSQNR